MNECKDIARVKECFKAYRSKINDNYEFSEDNLLWNLRVFYLKALMNRTNIQQFVHLDSDCILIEKTQNIVFPSAICFSIQKVTNPYHMVGSIHIGLLNNNFCDTFIKLFFDIYENKSKIHLVEPKRNWHVRNGGGGVCDMTLYYLMYSEKLVEFSDTNDIIKVNDIDSTFDHQFCGNYGYLGDNTYKMVKGVKQTIKKNGYIYIITNTNREIRALSFHFQGHLKGRLEKLNDELVL
jgi:hypothetical protein